MSVIPFKPKRPVIGVEDQGASGFFIFRVERDGSRPRTERTTDLSRCAEIVFQQQGRGYRTVAHPTVLRLLESCR